MMWTVIDPFYDPFEITSGIYLALDLTGLPVSGPLLLARQRLEIAKADECLQNAVIKVLPFDHP
ncbi:hypothetical protein ACWDYH_24855 [Nocardia goodfellowii]